jgi:hypothetical protein
VIDEATRLIVRRRAAERCESCRLPQFASDARFHIEHIIASQHAIASADDLSNLALACNRCNLQKGPNLSSIDPQTGRIIRLFHPRTDRWENHFRLVGAEIIGITSEGRATVRLLQMNARHRIELRAALVASGEF